MKFSFLFLVSVLVLISCSSSNSSPENDVKLKKDAKGKVIQVDFLDKDTLRRKGVDTENSKFEKAVLNTGFVTKKNWYKMHDDYKDYKTLTSKSVPELKAMLSTADAAKTTVLIEVLSQKGATAVSAVIEKLNDKRSTVFKEDKQIYWYEEKNKPPQDLEIRIYAAMHLEKMVNTSPYGVTFDFHSIRTDKGPVEVLYAVKGSFAVNKDDVCKNWLKWWAAYGGDYR